MSTAARIAATPSRIWAISRSSGPAHGGHDAELRRTGRGGLDGRLHQRRDVQPGRAHRRGEQPGLRAEVAVLGAAAGLHRDDALDLDLGAAPAQPHLVGEGQQVGQVVVGQAQHLEHLRLVEPAALVEHLRPGGREDVSGRQWWSARRKSAASKVPPRAGARPARAASRNSGGVQRPGAGRAAHRRAAGRPGSRGRGRCCGRPGPARPARRRSTTPARAQAAVRHRLEGQRRVVEGAERRVDDDEHVGAELVRQVGDRRALLVVPHQQPTGALDEHQVAVVGQLADQAGAPTAGRAGRQAAAPGGGGGRERVGEPRVARAGR